MKRKIAWLALPLSLLALVWGAKWRVEHPTPTKEDLAIRALLWRAFTAEVKDSGPKPFPNNYGGLTPNEFKPFIDSFYVTPSPLHQNLSQNFLVSWILYAKAKGGDGVISVDIYLSEDDAHRSSIVTINQGRRYENAKGYYLHPITTKRWRELLAANPRIGPLLREQKKF